MALHSALQSKHLWCGVECFMCRKCYIANSWNSIIVPLWLR
jgi:hypothetical protein